MIPDIGFIIAAYVIVRLLSNILGRTEEGKEHRLVVVLSFVAIVVTVACVADLANQSAKMAQQLPSAYRPTP